MYSNLIASSSNILYVLVASSLGDGKAWQKIDIGGILVTLYRLISDSTFILRIKREFIVNKINREIQGEPLNLEETL